MTKDALMFILADPQNPLNRQTMNINDFERRTENHSDTRNPISSLRDANKCSMPSRLISWALSGPSDGKVLAKP